MRNLVGKLGAGLVALAAAIPAAAANFPDKPVQLIVPYGAGGSTDLLARAVSQVAPKYFSQPLVVVNKPGGGGIPGRLDVLRARADGYTLLFGYGSGEDLVVPHQREIPFNPLVDFDPVARISIHSVVIAVGADSPIKTAADLVKSGKEKGVLNAAVATKGGAVDIAFLLFGKVAGVKVVTVPGIGGSDAITRLVGGHADFGGGHPSEILPHVKAGRLRPLCVALEKRDASLPDVPTCKEQGVDVVTPGSVKGVAVPRGTPKEIVAALEARFQKLAADPEFAKIMADLGQPVNFMPGAEYKPWLKAASDQYAGLIKTLGVETK
jgi:tripartite-type tricarboxylate transporter receptor subunit TctC